MHEHSWDLFDAYEDDEVAYLANSLQERSIAAHKAGDETLGNEYCQLSIEAVIALMTRKQADQADGIDNS